MEASVTDQITASDLEVLPEEVRVVIGEPDKTRGDLLARLGMLVSQLRDDAVASRRESGIEQTWLECEESYVGIDDVNRHEFAGARWAKPMTMEGPLTRASSIQIGGDEVRATAFIKLTSRYVDAGTAKVCDIALPIDSRPFTLRPSPIPELVAAKDSRVLAQNVTGVPMPGPNGQPVKIGDLAMHEQAVAESKAEKASDRIYGWMQEYKHNAEMRKVIFDGARLGVGVLKGPVPEDMESVSVQRVDGGIQIEMVRSTKPVAMWIDPWGFYPARSCGEDIHAGGYCVELSRMLPDELRDLRSRDDRGYITENIEQVIKEGPGKIYVDGNTPGQKAEDRKKQFEVWHFYGRIPSELFAAANPTQSNDIDKAIDKVFAIVTIVNDVVIRAVINPLDSGRLPYHVFNWSRRPGSWAGIGVAEQVKTPQRIVNGAVRALLNNAGKSAGAQIVIDERAIRPGNGDYRITPDKVWFMRADSGIDDVRKAWFAFVWPNVGAQLQQVMEIGFRMAEEHTSIPLITQGQSGKTTPDTFSGQQLQDNNANQLLRDIGYKLNDTITTPLVDKLYEWLLLDPDVPIEEKGDYTPDTSGALAIIEKALNDLALLQMASMLGNRELRIDPNKWFQLICRSKFKISPAEIQYSDEDWARVSQVPPPEPPLVTAAKIRTAAQVQMAQSRDQLSAQRNQNDLDRDTAYATVMAQRAADASRATLAELQLKYQIAVLENSTKRGVSIDEIKAELAQTAMKLNVQKELSSADNAIIMPKQALTPPTEPEGRAQPGHAYEQ